MRFQFSSGVYLLAGFHDGRCLTLEDTVEFFNLVFALGLTKEEKGDLAAFLRCL